MEDNLLAKKRKAEETTSSEAKPKRGRPPRTKGRRRKSSALSRHVRSGQEKNKSSTSLTFLPDQKRSFSPQQNLSPRQPATKKKYRRRSYFNQKIQSIS